MGAYLLPTENIPLQYNLFSVFEETKRRFVVRWVYLPNKKLSYGSGGNKARPYKETFPSIKETSTSLNSTFRTVVGVKFWILLILVIMFLVICLNRQPCMFFSESIEKEAADLNLRDCKQQRRRLFLAIWMPLYIKSEVIKYSYPPCSVCSIPNNSCFSTLLGVFYLYITHFHPGGDMHDINNNQNNKLMKQQPHRKTVQQGQHAGNYIRIVNHHHHHHQYHQAARLFCWKRNT